MRPVSSHSKQITDFCSWNGLLVLAGVKADAHHENHVFADPRHKVGLWFGGVDDLWKFGKPVGHGGPWKNSMVKAGESSDPYLMTGYDQKALLLTADADTTMTLEVNVDHQSGWHAYRTIDVKANTPTNYQFPSGFSAHWIRFSSAVDCKATAILTYK